MATLEFRLSGKESKATGTREVLARFYNGTKFNLRAKTSIFIDKGHFAYVINRRATEEAWRAAGKNKTLPVKVTSATEAEAVKHGYIIYDRGEIVVTERVVTPIVKNAIEAKNALASLAAVIETAYQQEPDADALVPQWLQMVVDKYHGKDVVKDDGRPSIFAYGEEYLKAKELAPNRERHFNVLFRDIARFEGFVRMTDKKRANYRFDPAKVTSDDIEGFFDYIRNEHQLQKEYPAIFAATLERYPEGVAATRKTYTVKERGRNTRAGKEKTLRMLFKWLNDTGRISNNPFKSVEIEKENYGTPYYLTLEERNLIADFDLSATPGLAVQRDIFIFQCLTGCRVGDLMKLTLSNVDGDVLRYIPHKTKDDRNATAAVVPLKAGDNDRALRLIEKYKGIDEAGRLFPYITPQRYNDAIKRVLTECGVTRMVQVLNPTTGEPENKPINEIASSHMARRTFVGTAYKIVSDPNIIGKMSGHVEGSRAFLRYRDIDEDILKDVLSKL